MFVRVFPFFLLLAGCGGLNSSGDTATTKPGDTGVDVVVEYRAGSSQGSGSSSDDTGTVQNTVTCYWDADGDGHGNGGVSDVFAGDVCPSGYAAVGDDFCEDQPSAYTETDCAAQAADADADGVTVAAGDCNDNDANVYPGLAETCDGLDNDCDGSVDEDATDATVWYSDADGDGYGAGTSTATACDQPSGTAATADDCDDTVAATNPGAADVDADGIDNDCDGVMAGEPTAEPESEEITCCLGGDLSDCMMTTDACPSGYVEVTYGMTCCADDDNDGYGDADECLVTAATECSDGYVEGDGDCDDGSYGTSPAEDDPYGDGRDQNCTGYDG